jgi:PPOX class probable F420-dependent enzyme
MTAVIDPATPAGAHAIGRLRDEKIGWLTTVTPDGQPQSTPVWFLWLDGEILVYGDHRARRNRNLEANPRATFHLDTNDGGGDVIVIEGQTRIDPDYPQVPDNPAYLAKYGAWIDQWLNGPSAMAAVYSMPILLTPTRVLAFGG